MSEPQPAAGRQCCRCGAAISACMGFVKAGDMLEFWDGRREGVAIRELCGRCALRWRWTAAGMLEAGDGREGLG